MDRQTSSKTDSPKEISRKQRTAIEAANALRQYDWATDQIKSAIAADSFVLTPDLPRNLNLLAVKSLSDDAGEYRSYAVSIQNANHEPPHYSFVPQYIEELCAYVKENWHYSAIHLASYVLWRVNWIHPFGDGNGRTARMLSYMILCIRLGFVLPGTKTIPEQISENKDPYYAALESADKAHQNGNCDLTEMEELLAQYLAAQLLDVHNQATNVDDRQ